MIPSECLKVNNVYNKSIYDEIHLIYNFLNEINYTVYITSERFTFLEVIPNLEIQYISLDDLHKYCTIKIKRVSFNCEF